MFNILSKSKTLYEIKLDITSIGLYENFYRDYSTGELVFRGSYLSMYHRKGNKHYYFKYITYENVSTLNEKNKYYVGGDFLNDDAYTRSQRPIFNYIRVDAIMELLENFMDEMSYANGYFPKNDLVFTCYKTNVGYTAVDFKVIGDYFYA